MQLFCNVERKEVTLIGKSDIIVFLDVWPPKISATFFATWKKVPFVISKSNNIIFLVSPSQSAPTILGLGLILVFRPSLFATMKKKSRLMQPFAST